MHSAGIICAQGDLWRDQRRFVVGCLKNFGMVKLPGTKRDRMEERILTAVSECISVNLALNNITNKPSLAKWTFYARPSCVT